MPKLIVVVFAIGALLVGLEQPATAQCTAPPPGLVSWWPLDETSGTTAADIVGANQGTHINGPTPVAGNVAGALSFDGVNDYVEAGTTGFPIGNAPRTMDAWARTTSSATAVVLVYGTMANDQGSFIFMTSGRMAFGFFGDDVDSGITINDSNWHHLAVTFDGSIIRTYVDGVAGATKAATTATTSGISRIGMRNDGILFPFDGDVDEVEIFDRALSLPEIQAIFNAGSAGKCKFVPFADFTTTAVEIEFSDNPNADKIKLRGGFTLGPDNNGIDPLNENVVLAVGTWETTIAAGSFIADGMKSIFETEIVQMELTGLGPVVKFKVRADGIDLTDTSNPLDVSLTIGDDGGTASFRLEGKLKE